MNVKRALAFIAAVASAAALVPSSLRADPTFESKRRDRAVVIDGEASEWAGAEAHYDEADGYKLGFFNDGEYLYVYFATWSLPTQRQILMRGLTVWFDGAGKKKKTLGINYPLGMSGRRGGDPSESGGAAPDGVPAGTRAEAPMDMRRPASSEDPVKLAAALDEMRREALIKSAAGDSLISVSPADSSGTGIRAMLRSRSRLLVIELRVPLDEGGASPYALNIAPGKAVSVGFETGETERPKISRPEGANEGDRIDGGGRPAGEMRPGGSPGGGMRPGGAGAPDLPARLKLWAKVKLASE